MIELGCLAGDPCLADAWSPEQRTRGLAYWYARTARGSSPPSIAPMSRWDLVRLVEEWLGSWRGLADFVFAGVVRAVGGPRGN